MNYQDLEPKDFIRLAEEKNTFLIRAPVNFDRVIEGTDLIMEDFDIQRYEDKLPKDKETKMLVYCRRGNASRAVCDLLLRTGYKKVYNLHGGMFNLFGITE